MDNSNVQLERGKKCYVEEYYGVRWVNVHNTYLGDMPPGLGGGKEILITILI